MYGRGTSPTSSDTERKAGAWRNTGILVPDKEGFVAVPVKDIQYVSYDAGITRLHLTGRRVFTVDMSLDEMERQLDPDRFLRVTRNHIVDVGSIERLTTWFSRKTKIVVSGWPEAEIYVIKERAPMLRRWLDR